MHYYKFNIGDYTSHTQHLDEIEDLAYRRMLDWCYLHESPLPDDPNQISRLIRMRTHSESIAVVLREFFVLGEFGWYQPKVQREIDSYKDKSNKAKASAEARWAKKPVKPDANALRTECEGNANHKPLTNNHKPLNKETKEKTKRFVPPSLDEIKNLISEKKYFVDAEMFFNFYESNGWKVGKNKMKKWEATLAQWNSRNKKEAGITNQPSQPNLEAERFKKAMGIE